MKKVIILSVALAMFVGFSVSAADDAKPKGKKGLSEEVIKKYDKNGDGKLDKDERAAYKADHAKGKKGKDAK